jgi:hypothetical protein
MAYMPGFTHDIFVSYAHTDNEPDIYDQMWVSAFVTDLKRQLRINLGVEPDIFFDRSNLEAWHVLDEILTRVRSSAIFVAIMSPTYVLKPWTMREFEGFQEVAPAGSGRTIIVEKMPLDSEADYPPAMRELIRARFFETTGDRGVPMSIGHRSQKESYVRQLNDLADQIKRRFKSMAASGTQAQPAAARGSAPDASVLAPTHGAVILGRVTDDLTYDREQLRRTLLQYEDAHDLRVIPGDDYPEGGDEFKRRFLADLEVAKRSTARLLVQLVGPFASKRPAGLPQGYETFQVDAAKAAGVPFLQWRRPEIDPADVQDPQQGALLGAAAAMTLESLKGEVLRHLEKKPAPPPPPADLPDGELIFLSSDQSDLDLAKMLKDELVKNKFGVLMPNFNGDMRKDLEENLMMCDSLVFVFGAAEPDWLKRHMLQYRKMKPSRDTPPRVVRIFQGPPEPKGDPGISLPEVREVKTIEDLIAELRRPG